MAEESVIPISVAGDLTLMATTTLHDMITTPTIAQGTIAVPVSREELADATARTTTEAIGAAMAALQGVDIEMTTVTLPSIESEEPSTGTSDITAAITDIGDITTTAPTAPPFKRQRHQQKSPPTAHAKQVPVDPNNPNPPEKDNVKRDQGELRRNEYSILIHVYRQMLTLPSDVRSKFGSSLRDQLSNLTGVGFSTAQKAIKFSKNGHIPIENVSRVGRKPKVLDDEYGKKVREVVERMNRLREPASATRIQQALKTDYGLEVSITMLRRDLLRLGLRWEQGPSTRTSTWKTRPIQNKRKKLRMEPEAEPALAQQNLS